MTTGNLWSYCGQSLAGLRLLTEVSIGYKKSLVKTLLNTLFTEQAEWPDVCALKHFLLIFFLRYSKIKKIVVHSNTIYRNSCYFVIDSQVCQKFSIHIIRKSKSMLMFLINPSIRFTGRYLKPSQHLRWRSGDHIPIIISHIR